MANVDFRLIGLPLTGPVVFVGICRRGASCRSRTSSAVTQSDLTISKARKPRISIISSFGRTSRYAEKFTKSRNRRADCQS